jgi:nucleoside 2-deoxyribosyltransferase
MNETKPLIRDIYISGPLFTPAERKYLEEIAKLCQMIGLSTYLPHRDVGFGSARGSQSEHYFKADIQMLQNSRCVLAVLNGPDIDSGTAWEIGFSYSAGKHIFGIREDIRDIEINPMLICTLTIIHSYEDLRSELIKWKTLSKSK